MLGVERVEHLGGIIFLGARSFSPPHTRSPTCVFIHTYRIPIGMMMSMARVGIGWGGRSTQFIPGSPVVAQLGRIRRRQDI